MAMILGMTRSLVQGGTVLLITLALLAASSRSYAEQAPDTWRQLGPQGVGAIAVSPGFATDRTIFVVGRDGVFKSSDGGQSWSLSNNGLPWNSEIFDTYFNSIAVSPAFVVDSTLFVFVPQAGVFRSTDAGATWESVYSSPETMMNAEIAISPNYESDLTVLIGGTTSFDSWNESFGNVVVMSTDGGASWSNLQLELPALPPDQPSYFSVRAVSFSPAYAVDRTLFAVGVHGTSQVGAILKSTDAGSSWASTSIAGEGWAIAVSPDYAADQTIFVGTDYTGDGQEGVKHLIKSVDGGTTWQPAAVGIPVTDVQGLAFSPSFAVDGTAYAATGGDGVFVTTDRGDHWQTLNNSLGVTVETADGPFTFQCLSLYGIALSPDYATDHMILIPNSSLDECGSTWAYAITGPAAPTGAGSDVIVELGNASSLTFSEVLIPGTTAVMTSTTSPSPEAGFQIAGVYYDIFTTASFAGPITVTLPYDPNVVTDPAALRLYHYDQSTESWLDVTTGVDLIAHTVTGPAESFSWFAVGMPTRFFEGFLPPISPDGSSVFQLGRTVPVKLRLADIAGAAVPDVVARLFLTKISDGVLGTEESPTSTSDPDAGNVFRYDGSSGQYAFNLGTRQLSSGTWRLRIAFDDLTSQAILISFKDK